MNERKIKIVHVVGGLHSGGVEAVIYNYFSHMNMNKFEVHIISNSPSVDECEKQFKDLGCIIHVLPERRKDFFGNLKQTWKIFKEYRFDILHSHMNLNSFYHMFLGLLAGIKVRIAHSHLVEFPSGTISRLTASVKKLLNKMFANAYFACGESAGKYMFGNAKVHILKNSINVNSFLYNDAIRNEFRKKLGISDKLCIGHVGRFTEQKNHHMILDIFRELSEINTNAVLMLIGTGELENDIRNKVNEYNLKDKVMFLGVKNDIYNYYQAMDAFLFPSTYEGLGIVLIEAQSASLPCIASDVVPNEVKITELVEFLPLNLSAKKWAEKINSLEYNERTNRTSQIVSAGYEINSAAQELEDWYVNQILH